MSDFSIIDYLHRRLNNEHTDPEARLMRDLHELPQNMKDSPSAKVEAASDIVVEERLKKSVAEATARLEQAGNKMLKDISLNAEHYAESQHLSMLTGLLNKAAKETPVHFEAQRRASIRLSAMFLSSIVIAMAALYGLQVEGWIPSPQISAAQSGDIHWAKQFGTPFQRAVAEWAASKVDSEEKLAEARTTVEAVDGGRYPSVVIRNLRACIYPGMRLQQDAFKNNFCVFAYPSQD